MLCPAAARASQLKFWAPQLQLCSSSTSLSRGDPGGPGGVEGKAPPEPHRQGYESHRGVTVVRGQTLAQPAGTVTRSRAGCHPGLAAGQAVGAACSPASRAAQPPRRHRAHPRGREGGKVQPQAGLPAPPLQPLFHYKCTGWKLMTGDFVYPDAKVP